MNEEKPYTQRTTVLSLESVADANIPWEQMQKIVKVAGALQDGEAVTVWKVAVQRMGEIVRVLPQVPTPCPKCGMVPEYQTDWFKKCVEVRCHRCGRHVDGPNAVEAVFEWNEQLEDERTGSVVEADVGMCRHNAERLARVLDDADAYVARETEYGTFNAYAHYLRLRLQSSIYELRAKLDKGMPPDRSKASAEIRRRALIRLYEHGAAEDFRLCVEHGLSTHELDEIRKAPEAYVGKFEEGSPAWEAARMLMNDIGRIGGRLAGGEVIR